jgi:hypothetical protein
MSELSDAVTNVAQPAAPSIWRADTATLTLRVFILACAIAGVMTTMDGLRNAWSSGVPARFGQLQHELWAVTPYLLLAGSSLLRVSRRSLTTLLVTTLLAWFMSTGYSNLDQMELGIGIIPAIQLAFIGGALIVMFTFWLLRKDSH